jgi:Protein of unknown function (DUF1573)
MELSGSDQPPAGAGRIYADLAYNGPPFPEGDQPMKPLRHRIARAAFLSALVPLGVWALSSGLQARQTPPDQGTSGDKVQEDDTKLPPGEGPRLVWEFGTDKVDFGTVMQGDVLQHTFHMKSAGTEDLIIRQAKPTCGCTVADVMVEQDDGTLGVYKMGAPIPTGRRIELTATLHTKNKQGAASSRINVFSNDPRGQRQLGLAAQVEPFFQVNPSNISFQQMSTRDTDTQRTTIRTTRGERVKLTMKDMPKPQGLAVVLEPSDADQEGKATTWTLTVTAGPGLNEGNLAYSVPLLSDKPIPGAEEQPDGQIATYEVTVTVMGRVTGMISVNPSLISLGLVRPGQVVSRTVRVTSHDPSFEIGEPKVHFEDRQGETWDLAQHFSTVLRPVAGKNAVDIEVRLDGLPETLNSSFSGMFVIDTGHPDKPDVKLPISGVCRGGVQRPAPIQREGTGGGGDTPPGSPR